MRRLFPAGRTGALGEAALLAAACGDSDDVVEIGADDFDVVIQVWEVSVVAADGVRREVTVDMANGTVVDNEVDD